jgi:aspartate/methionine/tyrosine aminotransferase
MTAVQAPIIPILAGLIRETPGTISLGQGVVSYGPPPACLGALQAFGGRLDDHRYGPVEGLPDLVDAIASKLEAENGLQLGAGRRIVVTAGGNMAFFNAVLAISDPGDEFVLPAPFYFNHDMAIAMAGCRTVAVPTDADYQLDLDALRRALTPRTRAIVTVSPNNPSGAVYPESALRQLNGLCAERGLFHIHDEAYEYFTYEGARHYSPGTGPADAEHTISLFSFSKAYALASWRVGYMVVPAELFEAVNKIQDTNLICPPAASQHAALAALGVGRAYCRPFLERLAHVRELVGTRLRAVSAFCTAPEPFGAFYYLLRVQTGLPALTLAERLIREYRVAVIPGSAFGLPEGCYLRVSYGALEADTVAEGVDRLVAGLEALVT